MQHLSMYSNALSVLNFACLGIVAEHFPYLTCLIYGIRTRILLTRKPFQRYPWRNMPHNGLTTFCDVFYDYPCHLHGLSDRSNMGTPS